MSETKKNYVKPVAAGVAVLIAAAIGTGLWMAAHPAKAPLQGQADARVIEVAPKIPGRIASVSVREGDLVKAGDILAVIDIPELTAKLNQVKAMEAAAQAKARLVDEGARTEQIQAAKAQYQRAVAGLTLAQKTFARLNTLFKEGLVSAQKHDEAKAALDNAKNTVAAAKSQYDMAVTGSRTDEKAAAQALAQQAQQGVAEVQSMYEEAQLKAPRNGEVSRVVLHAGEVTPAGFPLITLIDHDDKWVSFNIREDELAGLAVGTTFKARIPALNQSADLKVYWMSPRADYATWRSTRQSTGFDVKTFEVRARPVEAIKDLRPGMSVLVDR